MDRTLIDPWAGAPVQVLGRRDGIRKAAHTAGSVAANALRQPTFAGAAFVREARMPWRCQGERLEAEIERKSGHHENRFIIIPYRIQCPGVKDGLIPVCGADPKLSNPLSRGE